MNPLGLIVGGLGIVLVYVGVKGSQHSLASVLTGHITAGATASNPSGTQQTSTPGRAPGAMMA